MGESKYITKEKIWKLQNSFYQIIPILTLIVFPTENTGLLEPMAENTILKLQNNKTYIKLNEFKDRFYYKGRS